MSTPSALLNNAPAPDRDPFVTEDRYLSQEAIDWFLALTGSVNAAPARVGVSVILPDEDDSIPPTDLSGGNLATGIYRMTYFVRVTTPDGAGSAVQVNFGWSDDLQPLVFNGTNVTGDLVTSYASGMVTFASDGGSPITYETVYSSTTPNAMHYKLAVTLELVQAVS